MSQTCENRLSLTFSWLRPRPLHPITATILIARASCTTDVLAHDKCNIYVRMLYKFPSWKRRSWLASGISRVSVPRRLRWRQPHSWLSCHTLRSLVSSCTSSFSLSLSLSFTPSSRYVYGFMWVNVAPFHRGDRIFVTPLTRFERSHDPDGIERV